MPEEIKLPGLEGQPSNAKLPSINDLQIDQTEGLSGKQQGFRYDEFRFQPKLDNDNYKLRAQDQGFWESTGLRFANLIPNIAGGIVEGIGYLGELAPGANDEGDYRNWMTQAGNSMKNVFGSVYRENPNEIWDPADPAWWGDAFFGLVESASSFAAEGIGLAKVFGQLGKVARLAGAGRTGVQMANATGQLASAGLLAYTEGAMSGAVVFDKAYATQYNRGLAMGLSIQEAADRAKSIASNAAATTVKLNTIVNTALNFTAITPLFKQNDEIMDWFMTQGKRQRGESYAAWANRIKNADVADPSISKYLNPRGGIMGYAEEAVKEGTEEVTNVFAEKRGEAVGKSGKTVKDLGKLLGQLEHYLGDTMNSEGAFNFILGAFGGAGQTGLIDNIRVNKVNIDASGNPISHGFDNTNDKGEPKTKWVSSNTLGALGNKKYFTNVKDALVNDINRIEKINNDIAVAIKAKKYAEAERLKQSLFDASAIRSIGLGIGDNFKQQYAEIEALDNSTSLHEALLPQLDQLNAAIDQEQDQTRKQELEKQKAALSTQIDSLTGVTEAMQKGFAKSTKDNAYKETAAKAQRRVDEYQKLYKQIEKQHRTGDEWDSRYADYLFTREVDLKSRRHLLEDMRRELAEMESNRATNSKVKADPATYQAVHDILADTNTKEALSKDHDVIRKALSTLSGKEEAAKPAARTTLLDMANKYGIVGDSDEDAIPGAYKILDAIKAKNDELNERSYNNITQVQASPMYQGWHAQNSKKTIGDFLALRKAEDTDISEAKHAIDVFSTQTDIVEDNVAYLRSQKGRNRYIRLAKATQNKLAKEVNEKTNKARLAAMEQAYNDKAVEELTELQRKQYREVLLTKRAKFEQELVVLKNKKAELAKELSTDKSGLLERVKKAFFATKAAYDRVLNEIKSKENAIEQIDARIAELDANPDAPLPQTKPAAPKEQSVAATQTPPSPASTPKGVKSEIGTDKYGRKEYRFFIGDTYDRQKNCVRVTENAEKGEYTIHEGDLTELSKADRIKLFKAQDSVLPQDAKIVNHGKSSFDGIRHRLNLAKHGWVVLKNQSHIQGFKSNDVEAIKAFAKQYDLGEVLQNNTGATIASGVEPGEYYVKGITLVRKSAAQPTTQQAPAQQPVTQPDSAVQPTQSSTTTQGLTDSSDAAMQKFIGDDAAYNRMLATIYSLVPESPEAALGAARKVYEDQLDSMGHLGSMGLSSADMTTYNQNVDEFLKRHITSAGTAKNVQSTPENELMGAVAALALHDTEKADMLTTLSTYEEDLKANKLVFNIDGLTRMLAGKYRVDKDDATKVARAFEKVHEATIQRNAEYQRVQEEAKQTSQSTETSSTENSPVPQSHPTENASGQPMQFNPQIQFQEDNWRGMTHEDLEFGRYKSTNAVKGIVLTHEYFDTIEDNSVTTQRRGVSVTRPGQRVYTKKDRFSLNPLLNPLWVRPGYIRQGTTLILAIDDTYDGTINDDQHYQYGGPRQRADNFRNYTDENGNIREAAWDEDNSLISGEDVVGNVPIKVIDPVSGTVVAYLPRVDWVTAQYEGVGPQDYRNMTDVIYHMDGTIEEGIVERERERLLRLRSHLVRAWNSGQRRGMETRVSKRAIGIAQRTDDFRTASEMFPDESLQLAVLQGTRTLTGRNVVAESTMRVVKPRLGPTDSFNNVPGVLLPAANGDHVFENLWTNRLGAAEIDTVLRAIEIYLTYDNPAVSAEAEERADRDALAIRQATGFDIRNQAGLEAFVDQYYYYSQAFSDTEVRYNPRAAGDETPREQNFLFSIARNPVTGANKVTIKAGATTSGRLAYASVNENGELNENFRVLLHDRTIGMASKFRNIKLTDTERGIRGINDRGAINEVVYHPETQEFSTRSYDSYNKMMLDNSKTNFYGKLRSNDGTYVYFAHPETAFDENYTLAQRIYERREIEEQEALEQGEAYQPGDEMLFEPQMHSIPGRELTLANLQDMLNFTPIKHRNGRTPEVVLYELELLGLRTIPEGLNPFYQC